MFQLYAYTILEDRASDKLYLEVSHRNKKIQFIKTESHLWTLYFQGVEIATIIPGCIRIDYEYVDEIRINTAFDIMRHFMVNIMVSDEAYQIIDSF